MVLGMAGAPFAVPKLITSAQAQASVNAAPQMSPGQHREFGNVLNQALNLHLAPPQVATAGAPSFLDLAAIIEQATSSGSSDENTELIATRAGIILSEIERDKRDGVDSDLADAAAASAKYANDSTIRKQYVQLFEGSLKIRPEHAAEVNKAATFIISSGPKSRYQEVEQDTNVPWYVVGALHYREASLNFMGHLHNGDNLLLRTVHVPPNRPPKPWPPAGKNLREIWRISARDALQNLSKTVGKWTFARTCYGLESYNGFGCRDHGINTPYLWNYTNRYSAGGFYADHKYSKDYKSRQAGLVAIIKRITELDSSINMDFSVA